MNFEDLNRNQQELAIENLTNIQNTLGELGFTLSGDRSYFKDYGLFDGSTVRLVPVFDKGISIDMSYRMVGISVSNTKFVPMSDGIPVQLEQFPRECFEDVAQVVSKLAPHARTPLKESYILTAECNECGDAASSFVQVSNVQMCLDCAGLLEKTV